MTTQEFGDSGEREGLSILHNCGFPAAILAGRNKPGYDIVDTENLLVCQVKKGKNNVPQVGTVHKLIDEARRDGRLDYNRLFLSDARVSNRTVEAAGQQPPQTRFLTFTDLRALAANKGSIFAPCKRPHENLSLFGFVNGNEWPLIPGECGRVALDVEKLPRHMYAFLQRLGRNHKSQGRIKWAPNLAWDVISMFVNFGITLDKLPENARSLKVRKENQKSPGISCYVRHPMQYLEDFLRHSDGRFCVGKKIYGHTISLHGATAKGPFKEGYFQISSQAYFLGLLRSGMLWIADCAKESPLPTGDQLRLSL